MQEKDQDKSVSNDEFEDAEDGGFEDALGEEDNAPSDQPKSDDKEAEENSSA